MKKFRLHIGFMGQNTILIVLLTAITGTSIGWFLLQKEISAINAEIESKGLLLVQVLSTVTEPTVLLEDVKSLDSDLKGVNNDPDVVYAAVYNRDGVDLAGFNKLPEYNFDSGGIMSLMTLSEPKLSRIRVLKTKSGPVPSAQSPNERGAGKETASSQSGKEFLEVVAPVRWKLPVQRKADELDIFAPDQRESASAPGTEEKMETIGLIKLVLSLDNIRKYINSRKISVILLTTAVCLLGIFIGTFVVHRLVRPLQILNDGIKRISVGDLQHRVNIRSGNEIEQVAEAFNEMAGELQLSRNAIEEYSRNLEQKVEQRTREINEMRQYNENIVTNVPSALVVLDIKFRVLSVNPTFYDLFPQIESVDGLTLPDLPFASEILDEINWVLADGAALRRKEMDLRNNAARSGIVIQVSAISMIKPGSAETAGDGTPRILLVVDDVTKRKESEQIILRKSEDLENAYEQLKKMNELNLEILEDSLMKMDELQQAYEKLKGLDKMKDNFIASISHEFRTPLTAIKAITENLIEIDDVDRGEELEFLGIINSECDRLTRLIEDILDLSKIESGKAKWNFEDKDVSTIINKVVAALVTTAAARGLKLLVQMRGKLPIASVDEDRIIQVMTNLLSNALKFTDPGGEIVISARALGSVRDGGSEQSEEFAADEIIEISIRDTGRGIDKNELGKVFDRFSQVGSVLKGKPKGTGLGLSIVREIIGHHGGRVWVESEIGVGSTFHFTLRRRPPEKAAEGVSDDKLSIRDKIHSKA